MIEGATEKQPYEEFPIELDFAPWLATGETVSAGPTVTSRNEATSADTTATFLSGSPTVSGSKVVQKCRAGAAGERHIVQFRIVTSAGNRYEGEISISVREY